MRILRRNAFCTARFASLCRGNAICLLLWTATAATGACARSRAGSFTVLSVKTGKLKRAVTCFPPRIYVYTAKRLADAGVSIFKIEGRNRREQYVGETCSVYRKILDSDYEFQADDIKRLKTAFNRGDYTSGYLNNADNIIYPLFQGHKGIEAGII